MLVTVLLTLASFPVEVVARPDGAVAQPAAQVVMGDGEVTVAGKAPFAPRRGMLLQRGDRLELKGGAWIALVLLDNEYVVRLDDELSIELGKLALLSAPRRKSGWAEQLDGLLSRQEKEQKQRLIGWNVSLAGANTPAPQREVKEKRDTDDEFKLDDVMRRPAPMRMAMPTQAPPAAEPPPPPPAPTPAPPTTRGGGSAPPFRPDEALSSCLAQAAKSWGLTTATVELRARMREGVVVVQLPLVGQPAPQCAIDWVAARGRSLDATWKTLAVPLK